MRTAIVYVRVSSEEQVKGTSLSTQEQACREWCQRHDAEVRAVFREEGETAKTTQRPQFLAAIAWARQHEPDLFLVYRYDRFARNATDHAVCRTHLAAAGCRVVSATEPTEDDPAGRLLETLLSGIAQFDNEVRADRTRRSMCSVVARGGWVWRPPWGYLRARVDGLPTLQPDPDRAAVVADLFGGLASGARSYSETVRAAAAHGIGARAAGKMLRNPIYAGQVRTRMTVAAVRGQILAIVPPGVFEAAQRRLARSCTRSRVRLSPDYPLRGLLRCAECGIALTAYASRGRSARYAYYACRDGHVRVPAADVHAWFEAFLVAESENMRDRLAIVARAARLHIAEAQASADRQRAKQEAAVRVIEAKIGRLLDLHLSGALPADEYAAKRRELDGALLSARRAEAAAGENRVSTEAAISTLVRLLSDPVKLWRAFPVASRAQFVRLLFGSTLSLARTGMSRTGASACVCSVLRGADGAVGTMAPQSALSIESLATLCQCAAHAASLLASVA